VYSQLLLGLGAPDCLVVHRTVSGGAPDCVRCASRVQGEPAALGTRRRRTTIIHRTVRWCTRLSGDSSAAKSSLSGKVQRRTAKIHRTVLWCTGLSGEPTVDCATVDSEIGGRYVARTNGRKGAPDCPVCTGLSGAPTDVKVQWSFVPEKEGDPHRTVYSDCPVAHRTVRCATRQKARLAFQDCLQRLLATLGL
jgi:hypothetical protein